MSQRISQQQLESYLWGAATLLRGTIDAGDYKQFIFPLLFYKRLCDVFDEETQEAMTESGGDTQFSSYPETHRFQIPSEAHWREVRQSAKNVGQHIQSAMRAIETANPEKLYGIFGDAQWTNRDRLSDSMLRDLIEHFSTLELTIANLPEDELGQGYEYLIKKFADDSGHTAAEFYTNRTVVHLMTELLQPQPGESIYDPTCGSGGMLLSCIAQLRRQGKEWRNVRLYGQERNLMTSSIARMNCFLHGVEDFRIERGDTLSDPKFVQGDRLMQFDLVLANPPYSIKQWDREAFSSDPWGRNLYGTPPQGRADYAFWQHILKSLGPKTGRCAILFPHGVLFRQEEAEMRRKLIEADVIDCIIGLGPNLFYNSSMQSCVVICRTAKPKARRGRILFINAVNEVTRERAQSFLTDYHIERIMNAYKSFKDEPGFARATSLVEAQARDFCLNIPLYIPPEDSCVQSGNSDLSNLEFAFRRWIASAGSAHEALSDITGIKVSFAPMAALDCTALEPPDWLDRSLWRTVTLGSVAHEISNRVDDPAASGIERFVGLEHMDSGQLQVNRWGRTESLISSMKGFSRGDTLFARRNAYLKRASKVNFDGLCSGDAIVLREREGKLVRDFLPLILNTDRFWQYAIAHAAGTMSRRVNVKHLLNYEFALPPLDQQRCMADILWTVDEVVCEWKEVEIRARELHECRLNAEFDEAAKRWLQRPLGGVARVDRGRFSHRPRNLPEFYGGTHPFVQTGDVQNSDRILARFEYQLTDLGTTYSKSFPAGTVFITIAAVIGATAISDREVYATDSVVGIVPSSQVDVDYLELFLRHKRYFLENQAATQSAQKNINLQVLRPLELPCPPLETQREMVDVILAPLSAARRIRSHIDLLRSAFGTISATFMGEEP